MREFEYSFSTSIAAGLIASAIGKLGLLLSSKETLFARDYVIPAVSHLDLIAAAISLEFSLAVLLVFRLHTGLALWLCAWLASIFASYRILGWWLGVPSHPCPCLGLIGPLLGKYQGMAESLLLAFVFYMFFGSLTFLAGRRFLKSGFINVHS
jgi:hypothetical protein